MRAWSSIAAAGAMLQKLKLMFNLEIIAVQRNLAASAQEASDMLARCASAGHAGHAPQTPVPRSASTTKRSAALDSPVLSADQYQQLQQRALWTKRQDEVQTLLNSVTALHAQLQALCKKGDEVNSEVRQQVHPCFLNVR